MLYIKRNLSAAERVVRIAAGGGLAFLAHRYVPPGIYLVSGDVVAAILAATAVIGFCPACALFGRKPLV